MVRGAVTKGGGAEVPPLICCYNNDCTAEAVWLSGPDDENNRPGGRHIDSHHRYCDEHLAQIKNLGNPAANNLVALGWVRIGPLVNIHDIIFGKEDDHAEPS